MPQIPRDEIQAVWNETHPKNWTEFAKVLEAHRTRGGWPSDGFVDLMLEATHRFEQTGLPFPDSLPEVTSLLNEELQRTYNA